MNREEGLKLLKENLSNQNLVKHSLAVEVIMRALALRFGEDQERWALTGLLHDIDYEKVKNDLSQHSLEGAKMLEEFGLDKDICQAVKVHNEAHGIAPETLMEKALFVTDPLTGLIVAATLVREIIAKSEELLNIKLEEFVEIGLKAMQGIDKNLGLS